ncbi:hypothetical protein J6590_099733, partial [Homalodisca vitripennis]
KTWFLLHFSNADSFKDSAARRGQEMIEFGVYQRPKLTRDRDLQKHECFQGLGPTIFPKL